MAAIEGRWNNEKPTGEVLFAWPDVESRRILFAITLPPPLGSLVDSDSLTAGETGLNSIPPGEPAAGGHLLLQLPDHGWMRHPDARARLARHQSEFQAAPGAQSNTATTRSLPTLRTASCDMPTALGRGSLLVRASSWGDERGKGLLARGRHTT
jgi:cytochrome bd-type quinol oxidase subunit 1